MKNLFLETNGSLFKLRAKRNNLFAVPARSKTAVQKHLSPSQSAGSTAKLTQHPTEGTRHAFNIISRKPMPSLA